MPMKNSTMKTNNTKNPKNEDDDAEEEEPDLSGISRENNHVYFYSEIDRKSIFKLIGLIKEAEEYPFRWWVCM